MTVPTKEIQILQGQVSPLVKQSHDSKVENEHDVEKASSVLKMIRDQERMVEAKRQEFVGPLNQSVKAINDTFKQIAKPLVESRQILSGKILDWRNAEQRRIDAEEARRRKIQEAHKEAGHEVKAPVVLERPVAKMGNTQTRKVWVYKVTDFSKLPDQYKAINNVAIGQAIRDGIRQVPGLEIYQEEKLAIVGA